MALNVYLIERYYKAITSSSTFFISVSTLGNVFSDFGGLLIFLYNGAFFGYKAPMLLKEVSTGF